MAIECVVFGNVPLASWVIGEILKSNSLKLVGVVAEECEPDQYAHHGLVLPPAFHYCKEFDIPLISFDEAESMAESSNLLGISVRYNRIFREDYFSKFKPGIINLHGGELPKYRGSNIANQVILNDEKKIGGTLHFIAPGIDEGDVVTREFCAIDGSDTAETVFSKTLDLLKAAFRKFLSNLEETGRISRVPQDELIVAGDSVGEYRTTDLNKARELLPEDLTISNVARKARAFYFPGHQPAFIRVGKMKINLIPEFES